MLGPILFLLHIADIARGVSPSTRTSSYVDDTRVSRSISEPASDCQSLGWTVVMLLMSGVIL